VSDVTIYALLSTAAATALLHTLIPDHWLPFVLIGRARGWTLSTVAAVSGLSALIHTLLSVLMGFGALGLGLTAARAIGERLERVGGILLVLFGVGYALWAWRKGGHFHPGGALLHGTGPENGCSGEEGNENPEHLHYHADESLIRARWSGVGLAVIVGINPCVLVMPIMLAAVPLGAGTVALVATAYSVPTVVLMVGLSVVGVRIGGKIRLPGVARFAEMGSGLLIAGLGVVVWLIET
jgi:hypothetical protein